MLTPSRLLRFALPVLSLAAWPCAAFAAADPSTAGPAGHPAPPTAVAVRCICDDPEGQAYAQAVRTELSHDARFRTVSAGQRGAHEAGEVEIVSRPLAGPDGARGEAITLVYRHDGAEFHQVIETTCPNMLLTDLIPGVLDKVRELERSREELAREEARPERPRTGRS